VVGGEFPQGAALVAERASEALEEAADVALGVVGGDAVAVGPRRERREVRQVRGQRPGQRGEDVERGLVGDRERPAQPVEERVDDRVGGVDDRDGPAFADGRERDGADERHVGRQGSPQVLVRDTGHQVLLSASRAAGTPPAHRRSGAAAACLERRVCSIAASSPRATFRGGRRC